MGILTPSDVVNKNPTHIVNLRFHDFPKNTGGAKKAKAKAPTKAKAKAKAPTKAKAKAKKN